MRLFFTSLGLAACVAAAPVPQQPPPADSASNTAPAPPPAPARFDGWVFSGLIDGYVDYNANHPALDFNASQNFDLHTGTPRLSLAKFTIDKSDKAFGIHLDAGVGETLRVIHAADPAAIEHKGLRYIEQMYLIAKPAHTRGTEIDFGQFVSTAGAEVIESSSNWNYTRSFLFIYAVPYYSFGIKTTTSVTKELNVGFQLTNAWNTVWGNHNLQNLALTLALTKPKYTYSLNYLDGPNHPNGIAGRRDVIDSTILFTPSGRFNAYINADWGRDRQPAGGNAQWLGIAGAARLQLTKLFAVAARAEYFSDEHGFTTGLAQNLTEVTGTGEFKLSDRLVTRLEVRHDGSNHLFFDRGAGKAPGNSENTVTLGIVALLGPLK